MYYTVYKTTNKLDGKVYIGVHKTNDLNDEYLGSGLLLCRAIEKYGIENFEKEILAVFDKASEMFKMESELVNEEFVKRKDNYNLKEGGYGGWDHLNNGSKEHISRCIQGGRSKKSLECLEKGRETQKYLWDNDPEWRKMCSRKFSEALRKYYDNGGKASFTGKNHSEETKRKMSMAKKDTCFGKNNSQYCTMWICNLELKENKKIKKTDPIPVGWIKGRKMKF